MGQNIFLDDFAVTQFAHRSELRVRYSETDQMGTFYNSRALEWFECGRTEFMRQKLGLPYAVVESRGVLLPLVEAHLEFQGRARYDDLLSIFTTAELAGLAKLRFNVHIEQNAGGRPVVRGYTVHAFTDRKGRAIKPPAWILERLKAAGNSMEIQTSTAPVEGSSPAGG